MGPSHGRIVLLAPKRRAQEGAKKRAKEEDLGSGDRPSGGANPELENVLYVRESQSRLFPGQGKSSNRSEFPTTALKFSFPPLSSRPPWGHSPQT